MLLRSCASRTRSATRYDAPVILLIVRLLFNTIYYLLFNTIIYIIIIIIVIIIIIISY